MPEARNPPQEWLEGGLSEGEWRFACTRVFDQQGAVHVGHDGPLVIATLQYKDR